MKPKPLSSLNHLTVPVAIYSSTYLCADCARGGCWGATTAMEHALLSRANRPADGPHGSTCAPRFPVPLAGLSASVRLLCTRRLDRLPGGRRPAGGAGGGAPRPPR